MIYAINKRTKVHRIFKGVPKGWAYLEVDGLHAMEQNAGRESYGPFDSKQDAYAFAWGQALGGKVDIVKADADGWIEWKGGECPLQADAPCNLMFRGDPQKNKSRFPASFCDWSHRSNDNDIIAYRPILEPQAEQVKECSVGDHVVFPTGRGVIRLAPDVNDVVIVEDYNDGYKRVALSACELIRTDRERWIEAANKAWGDGQDRFTPDFCEDIFGALYDAGLARLPGE